MDTNNKVLLTKDGLAELKREHDELVSVKLYAFAFSYSFLSVLVGSHLNKLLGITFEVIEAVAIG